MSNASNDHMEAEEGYIALYTITIILGAIGNGLVITVYVRLGKLPSVTDANLLNLAISDLLLVLTNILYLSENITCWKYGDVVCKISAWINEVSSSASILFLTSISMDRYFAIVRSKTNPARRTTFSLCRKTAFFIIWLSAFLNALPDPFIYSVNNQTQQCEPGHDLKLVGFITLGIQFTLTFFLPLLIILFCYIVLVIKVCQTSILRKQQVYRIVCALISVFLLLQAPRQLCILTAAFTQTEHSCLEITYVLSTFSCCVNPIIYALLWDRFRQRIKELFSKCLMRSEKAKAVSQSHSLSNTLDL
ncbi:C-C chemokine receptor type 7-like [Lepisosteus oculatus]|uniref:C-C chemokine receptor type 7-like n=1 Tax=Lepisosteus oculatus TaxID=7918 RepID=UPI00371D3011